MTKTSTLKLMVATVLLAMGVGKVSAQGTITTWVGNGSTTYTGDGGQASAASIGSPRDVFMDHAGNLYFTDMANSVVRKVNTVTNIITTVAGNGLAGYSGDNGPATAAQLDGPAYLYVDAGSNIYFTEANNSVIRKVSNTGVITTIAGTAMSMGIGGDGGLATNAILNQPQGVIGDAAGNLYFCDQGNNCVRKINAATHIITTIAGSNSGLSGYAGEGGLANASLMNRPSDLCFDRSGNLLVADEFNGVIRKINHTTGVITRIAGTPGVTTFSLDNCPALNSGIGEIDGICCDDSGDVYVCDWSCSCRKITTATGMINIVAGDSVASGYTGDGGSALNATFFLPYGVCVNRTNGDIIVADYGNSRIRKTTQPNFVVVVPAGIGNYNTIANQPIVYPNPTNGKINVQVTDVMKYAQATIINVSGTVVYSEVLKNNQTDIDLSNQPTGIYFLSVKSGEGNYVKQITVGR